MAIQVVDPIFRGEPLQLNFAANPPANIAGWTIVFTLALKRNMVDKLYEDDAVEVLDAAIGTFRVTLPSSETDRDPQSYWWDVWRTDANQERLLAIGYLTIQADVRLPADV